MTTPEQFRASLEFLTREVPWPQPRDPAFVITALAYGRVTASFAARFFCALYRIEPADKLYEVATEEARKALAVISSCVNAWEQFCAGIGVSPHDPTSFYEQSAMIVRDFGGLVPDETAVAQRLATLTCLYTHFAGIREPLH